MATVTIKREGERYLLQGSWPEELEISEALLSDSVRISRRPYSADLIEIDLDNGRAIYRILNEPSVFHCKLVYAEG